jgi:coproporphyrinogen III oxidase
MTKETIAEFFRTLQDNICSEIEAADEKGKFVEDLWERQGGGGGRTRIMQGGNIIAKGGVNFSAVHGKTPPQILKALNLEEADFYATGVSIVMHTQNPRVPIIHMNVRYFEMSNGVYWFGGGIDLTPHYVQTDDARFFHAQLKKVCDKFDPAWYPEFKKTADDYFFIKHRNETRGIGGIFFDHMNEKSRALSKEKIWDFVREVGEAFAPIYVFLMQKNKSLPYGSRELAWQNVRRGRYVEFNLVYDKGTKFGLDTDGRTESILMSLPPVAEWHYAHQPEENSEESKTLALLNKGIDWV